MEPIEMARHCAEEVGQFILKVKHQENYSGEHREWFEDMTVPAGNPCVVEAIIPVALAMHTARQPEITALKAAVAELVEGLEKVFADPMSLVHSTKAMDEIGDLIAKHGSAKP